MSTNPVIPGPVPVPESGQGDASLPKKERAKPNRILPTDRINSAKQLEILRAYAAASNNGVRAVSTQEAADFVKMASSTVALANAFLGSIGLIQRADAGSFIPSSEVLAFLRAYEWNTETASFKLGPALKDSWFGTALIPRLAFGPMDEEQAIGLLGETCGAGPDYKKEVKMLLEFLAHGGLIIREGGQIKQTKAVSSPETPTVQKAEPPAQPTRDVVRAPGQGLTTGMQSTAGGVQFSVNVQVDMAEFATWRPERLQAFFRGIAEVLAAKADVERGGPSL